MVSLSTALTAAIMSFLSEVTCLSTQFRFLGGYLVRGHIKHCTAALHNFLYLLISQNYHAHERTIVSQESKLNLSMGQYFPVSFTISLFLQTCTGRK
jgi:hypothetical protein